MTEPTLKVIDHQDDFLVIDKPDELSFHDEGNVGCGFFSQIKAQLKSQYGLTELYPVHRLDKMTSGLIIVAKNNATAQVFQQSFQQHQIEKYYLAIANGKPKKKRYYERKNQRMTNVHLEGTDIGAILKRATEKQQQGQQVGDGGM